MIDIDKLVVVDYQEGAGGEFLARTVSAHWDHDLAIDQQADPNYLQKWLNSHSLIRIDWGDHFESYLLEFLNLCNERKISRIAVPYHLYKWPDHVSVFKKLVPSVRFIKIKADGFERELCADFTRKVLDRIFKMQDLMELKFILSNIERSKQSIYLDLFRQNKLTYRHFFGEKKATPAVVPPSDDIVVDYKDFFQDESRTPKAYRSLCHKLSLNPDQKILDAIIQRNRQDLEQRKLWMEKNEISTHKIPS